MQKSDQPDNETESHKVTAEEVLNYTKPTNRFLCSLKDNIYNIQFIAFKIRCYETSKVFFEIQRDPGEEQIDHEELKRLGIDEDEFRTVRYHFGPNFFQLSKIGTSLTFSVGDREVNNFRMIERHYFKDELIHSYDFSFPFCIPHSINNWESIYSLPELSEEKKNDMINSPWETKADSFYFVNDELIMHNKSEYNYSIDV